MKISGQRRHLHNRSQGYVITSLVRAVNHVLAGTIALTAILLLSACISPGEGLWPSARDAPAQIVMVSLDTWHAMIAFPIEPSAISPQLSVAGEQDQIGSSSSSGHQPSAIRYTLFEEWGYAERAWYLEGKTGLTGILRALFWPTEGVVEVGHHDRVWADRTPEPPAELFVFYLSGERARRLRQHLRSTVLHHESLVSFGQSEFYPARHSYHLFHTCHQYVAHALRETGLPISVFWAFNRTSLAWQLRRVARMAEERSLEIQQSPSY